MRKASGSPKREGPGSPKTEASGSPMRKASGSPRVWFRVWFEYFVFHNNKL